MWLQYALEYQNNYPISQIKLLKRTVNRNTGSNELNIHSYIEI